MNFELSRINCTSICYPNMSNKTTIFLYEQVVLKLYKELALQGLVVQSIVRLTCLLRGQLVKCFTTSFSNTLIIFVEKM